ncbi:MAG: ATP-binding protein [Crenarchaeota archaeon]|nr:ATP-binding protein [Thermoproteota archaeon]
MIDDGELLPVDRFHNLQNLLDMYEYEENDVLVNEAIANAVDAFKKYSIKSGKIDIKFDKINENYGYLSFHNNAPPIPVEDFLIKYHTVSFSMKQKGAGIGFAGVGAKLFLASKQGGEIITVTGTSKSDFIASRMHRTKDDDLKFQTTKKYPLKDILVIPNNSHTFGTTYSVRVNKHAYNELKQKLGKIIQYWWNYAILTKQIIVTIDGEFLPPWLPKGDQFRQIFTWKKEKIPTLCFISKELIPETSRHIIYTVFGKRIYNKELDLAIRIKEDFSNRVFCIVDLSILADQLTSNKENFKRSPLTNDCKSQIEKNFWKFLEDQKLLNVEFEKDTHIITNELTEKLDELLNTKAFKDLNPFLSPRKKKTLTADENGDIVVSEVPGEGNFDGKGGSGGDGSDRGIGDGTSLIEDVDGAQKASKKEKKSKGLRLVYTKKLQTHNEEARIEPNAGAIIIDELHPMYTRTLSNRKIKKYNLMRIVIEALIRHKNEEVNWDAKETMIRFRDLLHAVWGIK